MSIVKVSHNHVNTNVVSARDYRFNVFTLLKHTFPNKVIPAQAGIQKSPLNSTMIAYIDYPLDSRLRGNDELKSEVIKSNLIF